MTEKNEFMPVKSQSRRSSAAKVCIMCNKRCSGHLQVTENIWCGFDNIFRYPICSEKCRVAHGARVYYLRDQ